MQKISSTLIVFFDPPFWSGVYERRDGNGLSVCKITFYSTPKDYEVYAYLLENYPRFIFSPTVDGEKRAERHINPKRLRRMAKSELEKKGPGTKARQALKLMYEQSALEKKKRSSQRKKADGALKYGLRVQKKKQKHRGR